MVECSLRHQGEPRSTRRASGDSISSGPTASSSPVAGRLAAPRAGCCCALFRQICRTSFDLRREHSLCALVGAPTYRRQFHPPTPPGPPPAGSTNAPGPPNPQVRQLRPIRQLPQVDLLRQVHQSRQVLQLRQSRQVGSQGDYLGG